MTEQRTQPRRKIVAIMAADVAGYSRLMGRDEEGTYTALRGHLEDLFFPGIDSFEGRIIKLMGDGVLAEFPSAVDALNCAAKLQSEMAWRNRGVPADRRLDFRIGLHVGDVMEVDGDLFGDGVNTAARVEGTATPGGINISRFVFESVRKKVPLEFEDLGEHMFKSFEEPVQVFRVHGFARPDAGLREGEGRRRIAPGTRLNGIYEVDQLLAVGSTSEVYRARSVQTGDPVVIKAFMPELTQSAQTIAKVRAQASGLYHLTNDAIARTFLFSLDEAVGQAYLVMEVVDGISLTDRVRHEPLSLDEVHTLRIRLAAALAEAHAAGVAHLALSPDAVVLPEGDVAHCKLIDFTVSGLRPDSERTVVSSALDGKALFEAPEQMGHFGGEVGPPADVYSLGLVLAHSLTGNAPGDPRTMAELVDSRRRVPDLAALPASMRPLIAAMLEPDPTERTVDMAAVASFDENAPAANRAFTKVGDQAAPVRRRRGPIVPLAAAAALTIAVGAGAWFALSGTGEPQRDDPRPAAGRITAGPPPQVSVPAPEQNPELLATARRQPPADPPSPMVGDVEPTRPTADESAADTPSPTPAAAGTVAAAVTAPAPDPGRPASFASTISLAVLDGRETVPAPVAAHSAKVDAVNTGRCFFASVESADADTVHVDMYAPEAQRIYDAYGALKDDLAFDPNVTGRLISDGQCVALEFAQLGRSTSAMTLELVDRDLPSGRPLDGAIANVPNNKVLLIAIDPRGVVYNLSSALEPSPVGLRFVLSVNHPPRGTITNILLALSVPESVAIPPIEAGMTAAQYLPTLAESLATSNEPVAIRLNHFVLRS